LVVAAPATTSVRGYAVEVEVGRREGLGRSCVINCDWLVTLPKADLVERVGALSGSKLNQFDEALRFALGLDGA
jgi:mRNA-degrading endonuclease toxin of MazEF toxin-antitoxin module